MIRVIIATAMTAILYVGGVNMNPGSNSGEGWAIFRIDEVDQQRSQQDRHYLEFLRVADLSTGLYVLPAGGTDKQSPHGEDEIYYILGGRAIIEMGGAEKPVSEGSVIYVRAGVPHRFKQIEEELKVLVVFAPAFGTGQPSNK